ncbi:GNAT family N-acetyltransferase/peptidase C39 family protein [Glaciecola sp. 1036]|uniref:GNAT family N-acetyltransferase/peptidase C39 family protein n=1 Tax=Alteromonadaceae TaxID=72275 RepID=UPI003CFF965E
MQVTHSQQKKLTSIEVSFKKASLEHLDQLLALETQSFKTDRLSRRRFKHWIASDHGIFVVAMCDERLLGYGLVIMRKGTRLARLYSIAVSSDAQGLGIGKNLLAKLEQKSVEAGKLFLRLEVASNNTVAISLYEKSGYRKFGIYKGYYNNEIDAVRMQKPIRQLLTQHPAKAYPWYEQTTDFTCGPSALMMAMASINSSIKMSQFEELDIWRKATTIFMTSGHGGCHPLGLALAAIERGFQAEVFINTQEPLFIDGVRSEHKKTIMKAVDKQFLQQAKNANINVNYCEVTIAQLRESLAKGDGIVSLISTYQLDGKKIPHWVTITGIDEQCLYLHDSDLEEPQQPMDNQHIPIAIEDFYAMSGFGKSKLRTTVIVSQNHHFNNTKAMSNGLE